MDNDRQREEEEFEKYCKERDRRFEEVNRKRQEQGKDKLYWWEYT